MTKKSSVPYRAFYEAFNKYVLTVIADWLETLVTHLWTICQTVGVAMMDTATPICHHQELK